MGTQNADSANKSPPSPLNAEFSARNTARSGIIFFGQDEKLLTIKRLWKGRQHHLIYRFRKLRMWRAKKLHPVQDFDQKRCTIQRMLITHHWCTAFGLGPHSVTGPFLTRGIQGKKCQRYGHIELCAWQIFQCLVDLHFGLVVGLNGTNY